MAQHIFLIALLLLHFISFHATSLLTSTTSSCLRLNYLVQKTWTHGNFSIAPAIKKVAPLQDAGVAVVIASNQAGMDDCLKIDEFLMLRDPTIFTSLTCAKRQLRRGMVLLNSLTATTSSIVHPGDSINLISRFRANDRIIDESAQKQATSNALSIQVCYEDDFLAIINKPFGIPVFPSNGSLSVSTQLLSILKPVSADILDPLNKPQPVHRIDKDTGGLLLIAKTRGALSRLSLMFSNREIIKRYIAVCYGGFSGLSSSSPPYNYIRSINSSIGNKDAHTEFSVTNQSYSHDYGLISTLNVSLHTGRKHQIRRHLDSIGHPLIGDKVYWFSNGGSKKQESTYQKINPRFPHMLFSSFIQFKHPCCTDTSTGQTVQVNLEEPSMFKEMKAMLKSEKVSSL